MMERSVWKNRLASAVLAGVMGLGLSFTALPMPRAHADVLGAILAGVQGVAIYGQVDKALNYYNNTEEGRQKLFSSYKEKIWRQLRWLFKWSAYGHDGAADQRHWGCRSYYSSKTLSLFHQ